MNEVYGGTGRGLRGRSVPVLGVAGTAKNTGKTTTLNGIMRECAARDRRLCVTSIGFDGEEVDNVTGLPKPRIYCEKGVVVATASRCLEAGAARVRVLMKPGIDTALGPLVIGTVQAGGLVVLAGPNKTADLDDLLDIVDGLRDGPDLALVDGAFARIAPLGACDAIVLATGAARSRSIEALAEETASIVRVFGIPPWRGGKESEAADGRRAVENLLFRYADGRVEQRPGGSVLGPEDLPRSLNAVRTAIIPGAVSPETLELLASARGATRDPWEVVVQGPAALLASGDPGAAARAVACVMSAGGGIYAFKPVDLLAITVNPFYPERVPGGLYEGRCVDAGRLLTEMRRVVRAPLWDVVREGTEGLGKLVLDLMDRAIW